MSEVKDINARYHFRSYEDGIQPPPPTDDLDEALLVTRNQPVDIWDIEQERFVKPIEGETEYREVLWRVNERRRNAIKLRPKWGNILCALVILSVIGYSVYVLTTSPLEP